MNDFFIHSITPQEVAEQEGYDTIIDLLDDYRFSSIVPACCSYGCQVEPDGTCEHGFPSVLWHLGIV